MEHIPETSQSFAFTRLLEPWPLAHPSPLAGIDSHSDFRKRRIGFGGADFLPPVDCRFARTYPTRLCGPFSYG